VIEAFADGEEADARGRHALLTPSVLGTREEEILGGEPEMSRRLTVLAAALMLTAMSVGTALAAAPANDEWTSATPLALGVPLEFNSAAATEAGTDPTDCNGSHGPWPGPYYASIWFSFTATSAGQLNLSAPTMQGDPNQFLAISFVYQKTPSGLTLIDCTAFGNDASWPAKKGATYLIMEAGLSSIVTDEPDFSNRGGHGTIAITRTPNANHYSYFDAFTYSDCGLTVNVTTQGSGQFRLRPGRHGDATPYVFDNYEWHSVSTNPANGKWFREDGNGLYRDLRITKVEGTIYTFVAQETGRPYSLTAMDGTKVFVDRGRLLTTFQVDTKGDNDLGNDEFIDGSWALLDENGSHPGFFFDGDFCGIVQDLLG
jgi:hypothetical protein